MNFPSIIFQEAATLMSVPNTPEAFQLTFGLHPEVCSKLCNKISTIPDGCQAHHLLWTLLFLRGVTLPALSHMVDASPKVVSMWVWRIISLLGDLQSEPTQTPPRIFYSHNYRCSVFGYDEESNDRAYSHVWGVLGHGHQNQRLLFRAVNVIALMQEYFMVRQFNIMEEFCMIAQEDMVDRN